MLSSLTVSSRPSAFCRIQIVPRLHIVEERSAGIGNGAGEFVKSLNSCSRLYRDDLEGAGKREVDHRIPGRIVQERMNALAPGLRHQTQPCARLKRTGHAINGPESAVTEYVARQLV